MDKTIRRDRGLEVMKADEYRAWQKLQPHERLAAATELSIGAYRLKEPSKNVPPDFKELLSVFNSRKIRYLLIGGYAVSLYAQPAQPKTWICWSAPTPIT